MNIEAGSSSKNTTDELVSNIPSTVILKTLSKSSQCGLMFLSWPVCLLIFWALLLAFLRFAFFFIHCLTVFPGPFILTSWSTLLQPSMLSHTFDQTLTSTVFSASLQQHELVSAEILTCCASCDSASVDDRLGLKLLGNKRGHGLMRNQFR